MTLLTMTMTIMTLILNNVTCNVIRRHGQETLIHRGAVIMHTDAYVLKCRMGALPKKFICMSQVPFVSRGVACASF